MKHAYRQGDVVLFANKEIPSAAKKKAGPSILAYGEVTGHKHQIIDGDVEMYEKDGEVYISVKSDEAILAHGNDSQLRDWKLCKIPVADDEPHKPVVIPQGDYRVKIQREYEPDGWREVID